MCEQNSTGFYFASENYHKIFVFAFVFRGNEEKKSEKTEIVDAANNSDSVQTELQKDVNKHRTIQFQKIKEKKRISTQDTNLYQTAIVQVRGKM